MRSIRYLIVPGWHGSPDEHWQSHWRRTLPGSARVEQQDWLLPRREDWVAELQCSIAAHAEPVILVAHSLGCITVAHWAAQAPAQLLQMASSSALERVFSMRRFHVRCCFIPDVAPGNCCGKMVAARSSDDLWEHLQTVHGVGRDAYMVRARALQWGV